MTVHTGRTNVRQAIPNAIAAYWRPERKYGIDSDVGGCWYATIYWKTETGSQKTMTDSRCYATEDLAAEAAAALMDVAERAYNFQHNIEAQIELGE